MFCLFCVFVVSVLCLSGVSSCSLLGFSSAFSVFVLVSFLPLLLACFGFLPSFVSVPRLRSPSSSRFLSLFLFLARSLVLCSLSFHASLVLCSFSLTRFASDLLASRSSSPFRSVPRFGFVCWRLGCGGGGWGSLQYREMAPSLLCCCPRSSPPSERGRGSTGPFPRTSPRSEYCLLGSSRSGRR